jgi:predicted esterase
MKLFYTCLIPFFWSLTAHTQICNSPRFTEQLLFSLQDIEIDSNVVYGHALNWQNTNETLSLNLAFPKLSADTMTKRPMVMLIHGGGFVNGDMDDFNTEAYLFARRGFVAATINYRLGMSCFSDSLSYDKAVYRAMQDANAAMRFMINKSDSLRIDTNWVFIGGGSAGAGTCLSMVYLSQGEMNAIHPTIQPILGDLNNSSNNLTNTFTIKGIFNNWGGVPQEVFQEQEAVPTISFHGDADPVVPVDSAFGSSCVNPPYIYGSNMIHQKLSQWGICSQTIIKPGGDHGVYDQTQAATNFRIGKASCFFKSIMCGTYYSDYTTDSVPAQCSTMLSVSENNQSYSVYPNPAHSSLSIQTNIPVGDETAYIYNSSGKLVLVSPVKNEITLATLSDGIYFLEIRHEDQTFRYRFIKNQP